MSTVTYSSELSPFGARLRIAAALKGIDPHFELPPGPTGSAVLKEIHPWGRIPIMKVDGQVLVESFALLEYLEDAYPGTRSLLPQTAVDRARARMIVLLFDHNVVKALGGVFVQLAKPQPDVAAVRAALDDTTTELAKTAHFFDAEGPAVGGALSIADCAIAPFAFLIDKLSGAFGAESPTARVERVARWWETTAKLPEVATVTALMAKALAARMAARPA